MTQRRREQGLVELTLLAAKRVTCREVRGTVSHTMALNKDHKISCGRGEEREGRGARERRVEEGRTRILSSRHQSFLGMGGGGGCGGGEEREEFCPV